MKHFVPIYLAVAVAGTAAVWYAAPLLVSPKNEGASEPTEEKSVSKPPAAAVAETPAVTAQPESAQTAAVAQPAPVPATENTAKFKNAEVAEEDILPPSMHDIYIARSGDNPTWGVVMRPAVYYNDAGSNMGTVDGGTFVKFKKFSNSSKGTLAACYWLTGADTETLYLVKKEEVLLFTGDPRKLARRQMDDLQRYYLLRGKATQKKDDLLRAAAEKNPYFKQYQEEYKKVNDLTSRAKDLEKKRNEAEGMLRDKYMDELQVIKNQQAVLLKNYNEIRQQFNDWKKANVNVTKLVDQDPEIVKWRAEMEKLMPKIPGLVI